MLSLLQYNRIFSEIRKEEIIHNTDCCVFWDYIRYFEETAVGLWDRQPVYLSVIRLPKHKFLNAWTKKI
jgi:hypothetical protein